MDADRHECPRLSEACAAVVEKRRSGRNGRENAAAGDGQPGGGNGPGNGTSRTRRNGQLRAEAQREGRSGEMADRQRLSLIHISEPTRLLSISYAVFCLKKKKKKIKNAHMFICEVE